MAAQQRRPAWCGCQVAPAKAPRRAYFDTAPERGCVEDQPQRVNGMEKCCIKWRSDEDDNERISTSVLEHERVRVDAEVRQFCF